MGTHMWTGVNPPVSRRGRRMSLELPPGVPPIPLNPKDAEFLQQRQRNLGSPPQPPHPPPRELSFFPYLPTPFSVAAAAAAATTTTTASAATNSETAVPRTSMSDIIVTANGIPLDVAAGQPLPATLGHFGRLAAAVAADQEQRKSAPLPDFGDGSGSKEGGGAKEVLRGDSPEPLRVRSPGSLRELSRSPQAHKPTLSPQAHKPTKSPQEAQASEDERRFSHEPWNWKLGSASEKEVRGQEEGESADKGEPADRSERPADDKIEHRGPQEQKMSESLVA